MGGVGNRPCFPSTTDLATIEAPPIRVGSTSVKFFRSSHRLPAGPPARDKESQRRWRQLGLQQIVDFPAQSPQVVQAQVYDGIADVGDLVHFLETTDDHIA